MWEIEEYPTLPVLHIETLMIYNTTTLSDKAFRMDWWEIGYMRDPTTGEIARQWLNPITGALVDCPDRFEEGPSHFIIEQAGAALEVSLVQAHARIESVEVNFTTQGGRVFLEQTERKVRGFPLPDGSMPSLDSDQVSSARTMLSVFASQDDLAKNSAHSSGAYEFELAPPAWMGFGGRPGRSITRGIMVKAGMNHQLNPLAWQRMKALFPDCFDGESVRPRWSTEVTARAVATAG